MHWTDAAAVYHPREPKSSPLWRLLDEHFPAFLAEYDDRFLREYGFLRPVIADVVAAFRQCGDLSEGFARVRCPDCHHEYLLAFSCRGRWLLTWRHNSGFSVHNGVRLARDDEASREALAQYIIRNPFAVSKITYNPASGMVIYKSKPTQRRSKGGRRNFQVFSATEFIAAITQHIPEKSFQLVRYYGWYSNRGRGGRANRLADAATTATGQSPPPAAVEVLDVSDYRPRKIPSPTWRECIKKVWEIDPLACPKCGGEMKIISFITEAAIIRRILEHLGLWTSRKPKPTAPASRAPPALDREKRYEPFDDGWPQYEEHEEYDEPLVVV